MSFCANCGSKLRENDAFCGSCGKKTQQSAQVEGGENNNQFTNSNNADDQKAFHSAKSIDTNSTSTALGNLTYLKDFSFEDAGLVSISYIDGIVVAEDKTSQTHVHGHDGHVSSSVVNRQYIHIQTANGKEINITARSHLHFHAGNHIRLYYFCKNGTKPLSASQPHFMQNTDSDMIAYGAIPDFMPAKPRVDWKFIAILVILGALTGGIAMVFVLAWFFYRIYAYNKKFERFVQCGTVEINRMSF
ncbi:zinc ribbon domain-containing protein [Acidithiobacillus sp.]|uniref:zinc ribbon domain-containing protein n=1 Tax=Acidithiobacillus sp. TaxID=1872118 RepID=UPI00262AE40C|nr:zinc ribbon domain-containing protein [Acidithiobacillus sp.]MDD2749905.1 zinc ribbon domain-containing protein [Acidithiobacillus sp.]MDD5280150.1 zinc ribbon domain-containing protein [Acidithiobacillus sp.]